MDLGIPFEFSLRYSPRFAQSPYVESLHHLHKSRLSVIGRIFIIIRTKVVLPEPDSPTIPRDSAFSKVILILFTPLRAHHPVGSGNRLHTFLILQRS